MLRQLKVVKKELALRKREANEAMRQMRTQARQRTALVHGTLPTLDDIGMSALCGLSTHRWRKIGIRLEKEAAVAPHETIRAQLERQILVVERAIQWVEKFK